MDKIEIHELCARSYLSVDHGDAWGFARKFTEDGVFIFQQKEYAGPEEICKFLEKYVVYERGYDDRHLITNHIVEPHLVGARSRFHVAKVNSSGDYTNIMVASAECLIRKNHDGWYFVRFKLI
ncbi:nuclear transport factor 2 family protein [Burkholderia cenocepacia]|nr:nuclear transport factor 2 family protein [Burkholderia cenocepacia]MCW3510969.1 nuclear transport factor 2 family protein [Burkholderia cenocepacia]MCW3518793.1 nuclear transport factor 2 family protein [Burkholderia cenocepacia]MCW3533930.1 nuclear transport factor 2 family protein [Burkholderia cenocepacia]MCW3549112.1 nuclear transport factor 2 family protein [Burkholderia cenocepacia]MCW3556642.1 nuclear transport factor 2 family protein [Burkholderia cenocepacia]